MNVCMKISKRISDNDKWHNENLQFPENKIVSSDF